MNKLDKLLIDIENSENPEDRARLKTELGNLILKNRQVLEEEKRLDQLKTGLAIESNI